MNATNENKSGKMEHSKEPWKVDGICHKDGVLTAFISNDQSVGHYIGELFSAGPHTAEANADRIVACINFCEGVDLSLIPDGGLKTLLAVTQSLGGDAVELTSLRSKLSAAQKKADALKKLADDWHDYSQAPCMDSRNPELVIRMCINELRAILASEGKE